jgi:hypothetical protein
MSDDALRFRFEPGELKLAELLKAVETALLAMDPLAAARATVSPGFWVTAAKSAGDLVLELVDVKVADVLVGAWKTHRTLRKFADPVKYPPGTTSTVPLATHKVSVKQSPAIEILVDGQPQGKIPFGLELELTVDAGVLTIRGGRILRMGAGRAKATGRLTCAGVTVAEQASRSYEWNAGVGFGEGIAIGG